jgi:uncharacterized protein with HEPN domain
MMQSVIIREVISRIGESYKETQTYISWQKIKGFRNLIAHDYFGVMQMNFMKLFKKYFTTYTRDY